MIAPILVAAALAAPAPQDAAPDGPTPFPARREIFVPVEEFARVMERHPRGVLLERRELEELLEQAARLEAERAARPPRSFALGPAAFRGRAEGEGARLTGRIPIDLLVEGPLAVPLRLQGVPVRSARVDGREAYFLPLPKGHAALVLEGAGRHTLEVGVEYPLRGEPSGRFLEARLPAGLVGSVEFELPGRPRVVPNVAGTARRDEAGDRTVWRGTLPADGRLSLAILPPAGEVGGEAIVAANVRARWVLGPRRSRVRATLRLRAYRGAREVWIVRLPPGLAITSATAEGLTGWAVTGGGADRALRVDLARPVAEVALRLEGVGAGTEGGRAELPALRADGALLEDGIVAVAPEAGFRLRILEVEGYERVDPPRGMPRGGEAGSAAAYAYRRAGGRMVYALEPIEPRLSAAWRGSWEIEADRLRCAGTLTVTVAEGAVYALSVPVPEGYRVASARPAGAAAADVEEGRIAVRLPDALAPGGRLELRLELEREPERGAWRNAELSMPVPVPRGVEALSGRVTVRAAEPIRPTLVSARGLEPAESGAAKPKGSRPFAGPRLLDHGTWRITGPGAAAVWRLEEAPTRLEAESVVLAAAGRDVVRVRGGVRLEVRGRGRDTFALLLRRAGSARVEIEGDGIRERVREGAEPGDQRWRIRLQERRTGSFTITFHLDIRVEDGRIEVPSLEVPGAARHAAWLAAAARDETEVVPHPAEVTAADPRELPPLVARPEDERLLFAYRARPEADARLDLELVRHDPRPSLAAVVLRADLESFLATDGRLRTRARLKVRNAGAEWLRVRLAEGGDLWSVRVGEEGTRPIREGVGFAVPIPIPAGGSDVAVEIVYEEPAPRLGGWGRLELEGPSFDAPVLETRWRLTVPEDLWVWRADGNVTGYASESFTRWLADWGRALGEIAVLPRRRARMAGREVKEAAIKAEAPAEEAPRAREALPEAPLEPERADLEEKVPAGGEKRPELRPPPPRPKVEGILGLEIPLEGPGRPLGFHRLGGEARVVLRYASQGRMRIAVGVVLLLGVLVLWATRRRWRGQPLWALAGASALTAAIPRIANAPVVPIANAFFYGAILVIAGDLAGRLARFSRRIASRLAPRRRRRSPAAGATLAFWLLAALAGSARGAPARPLEVFVPYDPSMLPEVTDAGRIYLDEETFRSLWTRAFPETAGGEPPAYGISAVRYTGRLAGERAAWEATFVVRVPSKGWQEVPLGLDGASIASAALEGGAPVALFPSDRGHRWAVEGPGLYRLRIAFEVPVAHAGPAGSVRFGAVPAPAGEVVFRMPHAGFRPEIPGACASHTRDEARGEVEVAAAIGGREEILVRWGPAERAPATAAGLAAEETTLLVVERDRTRIEGHWTFRPGGSAVDRIAIRADPGIEFLQVRGPRVKTWAPAAAGGAVVLLEGAMRSAFGVRFSAIRLDEGAWASPALEARGAARLEGLVGIAFGPGVKGRVAEARGLARVDPGSIRIEGVDASADAAFRHAGGSWRILCERAPRRPVVRARARTLCAVRREALEMDCAVHLEIAEAEAFAVRIDTGRRPEGFRAEGAPMSGWSWSEAGDRVVLEFARGASGGLDLTLRGRYPRRGDEVAVPVWRAGADRSEAEVGIGAEAGLRLQALEAADLEAIPASRLGRSRAGGVPAAFAYRVRGERPRLRLRVERVMPRVRARAILDCLTGEGLAAYGIEIAGTVEGAPAGELRFETTGLAAEDLRLVAAPRASALSSRAIEGARRAWTVRLGRPVLGDFRIALEARAALPGARDLAVPSVALAGCEEERYFVRVRNEGPQRVAVADRAGLRPLAAAEWPGEAREAIALLGAPQAGWRLALALQPLEAEKGLEAVVDLAEVTTLVLADGTLRHRIRYRIINRKEQFLALRIPEGLEIWSVLVDGRPAKPADGPGGTVLIPLPKRGRGDLSFDVVALLSGRLADRIESLGAIEPALPAVENMEVAESFWRLYLPEGPAYWGFEGNMTPTVEAVLQVSLLQKAFQEFEEIVSIARRGRSYEKQVASRNIAIQGWRLGEQLQRAEQVQGWQERVVAGLERDKQRAIEENRARIEKLRGEIRARTRELGPGVARWSEAGARRPAARAIPRQARKGILSLELPFAPEGRAYHFQKPGGRPRLRVKVLSGRWRREGLPAARLLALLLILGFLGRFRLFALPVRSRCARGLVALATLAGLAAASVHPIATLATAAACAVSWIALRRKRRALESRAY